MDKMLRTPDIERSCYNTYGVSKYWKNILKYIFLKKYIFLNALQIRGNLYQGMPIVCMQCLEKDFSSLIFMQIDFQIKSYLQNQVCWHQQQAFIFFMPPLLKRLPFIFKETLVYFKLHPSPNRSGVVLPLPSGICSAQLELQQHIPSKFHHFLQQNVTHPY